MSREQQQPQRDMLADLARHTQLLEAQVAKLTQALQHWQLLEAEYEALADEVRRARAPEAPQRQQAELVRLRREFDGQLVDHNTVCELFGARPGEAITRSVDHIASAVGRRLDYVQQNAATLQKQVAAARNKLAAAQVVSRPGMPAADGGGSGSGSGSGGHDDVDMDEWDHPLEDGVLGDDDYGPVTDIVEQLDDDDNVVSFQLHTPASTQPQVLEALKKAGIDEIPAGGPSASASDGAQETSTKTPAKPTESSEPTVPAALSTDTRQTKQQGSGQPPRPSTKLRKGVSFADDTKPGIDHGTTSSSHQPQTFAAQRLEKIIQSARDQEALAKASPAVVPEGEDEDAAALRREMLEYSMSEIGPIVAQLDIDEGLSDDEDEGYDDDSYDEGEDEDEEDQYGRSKYSVIDEAYRERMRELERKLGVTPFAHPSIVPPKKAEPSGDVAESLGRIRVSSASPDAATATTTTTAMTATTATTAMTATTATTPRTPTTPMTPTTPTSVLKPPTENFRTKMRVASGGEAKKKTVSFATDLDIAPEATPPTAEAQETVQPKQPSRPLIDPLSDIVERNSSGGGSSTTSAAPDAAPAKPKRVSRFKMARSEVDGASTTTATASGSAGMLPKGPHQAPVRFLDQDRREAPSGPEGKTHSDNVVERQAVTEPREPHELDAGLVLQETAMEYHRTRNRLIQQQGGFLKASEAAVVPISADDGGPRVSKFKAARLGQQFMGP